MLEITLKDIKFVLFFCVSYVYSHLLHFNFIKFYDWRNDFYDVILSIQKWILY